MRLNQRMDIVFNKLIMFHKYNKNTYRHVFFNLHCMKEGEIIARYIFSNLMKETMHVVKYCETKTYLRIQNVVQLIYVYDVWIQWIKISYGNRVWSSHFCSNTYSNYVQTWTSIKKIVYSYFTWTVFLMPFQFFFMCLLHKNLSRN